jgi:uncharacterized membrane protein (UPF0182 family)
MLTKLQWAMVSSVVPNLSRRILVVATAIMAMETLAAATTQVMGSAAKPSKLLEAGPTTTESKQPEDGATMLRPPPIAGPTPALSAAGKSINGGVRRLPLLN